MRTIVILLFGSCMAAGQTGFGTPQPLIAGAGTSVAAVADLDGDGDSDVALGGYWAGTVVWYENLGTGAFGPPQTLTSTAAELHSLMAEDMDGDGDTDIVFANQVVSSPWAPSPVARIAWFENLGSGSFGPEQSVAVIWSQLIHLADLGNDGDVDVLMGFGGSIALYENLGGGTFGPHQWLYQAPTSSVTLSAVDTADIDGDGDNDLLSTDTSDDNVAWYENLGGGSFGPRHVIFTSVTAMEDVDAADLDGDGDPDVIATDLGNLAWFENLGGTFGPRQIIDTSSAWFALMTADAADLDGDGDTDVVRALRSGTLDEIAWYENQGSGTFGAAQVIATAGAIGGLGRVGLADIDADSDPDVFTVSGATDGASWMANRLVSPTSCPVGACLDLQGNATINSTVTLRLRSPAPNAPCVVFAATQIVGSYPILTVASTTSFAHLALTSDLIPFADPFSAVGPSLTNPVTDALGDWSATFHIPNDPTLVGVTVHAEALVIDSGLLPNALLWQASLLTVTLQ